MNSKVIISDTSCLILYERINQLDILRRTYDRLIVTQEVAEKFSNLPSWISINKVTNKNKIIELTESLGLGEASSIALAL